MKKSDTAKHKELSEKKIQEVSNPLIRLIFI